MTRTTLLATALVALLSAAGAAAQTAPNINYNPAAGTMGAPGAINFGAGPAGNVQSTVVLTPSGGSGTGAAATTTVNCVFRDAQFSPARLTFCASGLTAALSFEGATTSAQNLALCCDRPVSGNLANQVQCTETRGASAPVSRVWDVSCGAPTNTPPQISSNPAVGTTINVCPSRTASITVTNAGGAGATPLTVSNCAVSPGSQFTVNPTSLTVPLGAVSGNVLNIVLPAGAPVPTTSTLSCDTNAINATGGVVSWTLLADNSCNATPPPPPPTGPAPTPVAIPAGDHLGYLTLLALLLGTGVAVVTMRKR
ncbi:MAG: hypothetical protein MUE46_04415 [Xanthomonadales bacterium]|jgi:hypothetical protein|nr:hypothetical protein [Xanthomonadales bacterium]